MENPKFISVVTNLREVERTEGLNYLERNAQVIAEMQGKLVLSRGPVVGRSESTTTTAMGSYQSKLYEGPLYVALKETRRYSNPDQRVARDLSVVAGVAQHIPELIPELPFFLGLVRDKNGVPVGTITEDFSKGGRFKIWGLYEEYLLHQDPLPERLRQYLSGTAASMETEELAGMFFRVDIGEEILERRVGDFDHARHCLRPSEVEERFPFDTVLKEIGKHTLTVNYDF